MVDLSPWFQYTDKGYAHNVLPVYERLLNGKDISHILEIGVLHGESIRMWAGTFPEADVWGIDIDDRRSLENEFDNVKIICGDAYNKFTLESHLAPPPKSGFDLIVEDGSHILRDQCLTAEIYSHRLSATGVMIIEDIASIEHAHLIQSFLPEEFLGDSFIIDRRGAPCDYPYERFEDRNEILVVVDRRGA